MNPKFEQAPNTNNTDSLERNSSLEVEGYIKDIEEYVKLNDEAFHTLGIYLPLLPEDIFLDVQNQISAKGFKLEKVKDPSDDSRELVLVTKLPH